MAVKPKVTATAVQDPTDSTAQDVQDAGTDSQAQSETATSTTARGHRKGVPIGPTLNWYKGEPVTVAVTGKTLPPRIFALLDTINKFKEKGDPFSVADIASALSTHPSMEEDAHLITTTKVINVLRKIGKLSDVLKQGIAVIPTGVSTATGARRGKAKIELDADTVAQVMGVQLELPVQES